MPSFIQRISNLQQVGPVVDLLITPSIVYLQALGLPSTNVKAVKVLGLIDTGASETVISEGIAEKLGIKPVSTTNINTPSSTNVLCCQYDVQLIFQKNVNVASIVVTEAPLKGQHIQCLIGRDILAHSVLIYTGYDNSFTLSF